MDVKQASQALSDAWQAVEASSVPNESRARAVALGKAIDLIAGVAPAAAPVGQTTAIVPYEGGALPVAASLDQLAAKLQLPRDVVERVYAEDSGRVELELHPGRLPRSKSTATRDIALLVAAQHQAASDEPTVVDDIRKVVQDYDRLDPANYSSSINELRGAVLIKGERKTRTIKLTRAGWAQAADRVRELAGEG